MENRHDNATVRLSQLILSFTLTKGKNTLLHQITLVLYKGLNVSIHKQNKKPFLVLLQEILFTVDTKPVPTATFVLHSSPLAANATCPSSWTRPSVVEEARQKWGRWRCCAGLHSNFHLGQKQTCISEKNRSASVTCDSARRSTATAGN